MKITEVPLAYVDMSLAVEWVQEARGEFNLFPLLARYFSGGIVNTLTPQALTVSWPEEGRSLRKSGYTILSSQLREITPPKTGILALYPTLSGPVMTKTGEKTFKRKRVRRRWFKGSLEIGWAYKQKRRELVSFRVTHQHQLRGQNPLQGKKIALKLQAIDQGGPVSADQKERSIFFLTDRGRQAIAHAIEIAKAHLAAQSRCLMVELSVPLTIGIGWCPDTSLTIYHGHLPNGKGTGKVKEIVLKQTPEKAIATVKVVFALGVILDGSHTGAIESYVEPGYCEENPSESLSVVPLGPLEGLAHPHQQTIYDFVTGIEVVNDGAQQSQFLYRNQYPVLENILNELRYHPTEINIALQSLKTKGVCERQYTLDREIPFSGRQQLTL